MQRIESFDILKGFGISLMIAAHTYGPNSMIWDFIYAFHMPLFFIVSGYFFKPKAISEVLRSNRNQLLIPYLTMCLIVISLTQIRQPHNIRTDIENTFCGLGPGWFMLAMILARIEFLFILKLFPHRYISISLIISTIVCITAYYNGIPAFLSFFPSLASLLFFATGYYSKQHKLLEKLDKHPMIFTLVGLCFWLITSIWGKVELSQCIFKLSIVDFAGSIGGTLIFYKLSQCIEKHKCHLRTIISYIGRFSLVILFFHSISYCVPIWYLISPYFHPSYLLHAILIIRFLFLAMCVIITLRTKWLRCFFNIK